MANVSTSQTTGSVITDAITIGDAGASFSVASHASLSHAVNSALAGINVTLHRRIQIQAGTYDISSSGSVTITPVNGVKICGSGIGRTIIRTARPDYVFKNPTSGAVSDFWIEDMTIDCQNLPNVNAVCFFKATRSGCRRVEFKNSSQWFVKIGCHPADTTDDMCVDCSFEECVFDNHSSIYEALLIYNARNTYVTRCTFSNNSIDSPVLGLWQKTDNTVITDCTFTDCADKTLYYSATCHNTVIRDCVFKNCGSSIQGGNVSDYGLFGQTYIKNLTVQGCRFYGGINSRSSAAIQFGAVDGCFARNNYIEGYERGILFGYGNQTNGYTANYPSKNGIITNNFFKNINPNNDMHAVHTALKFDNGAGVGMMFSYNKVLDDQTIKTLRYAISFNGTGSTYSNMQFMHNDLPVDTANAGKSYRLNDSIILPGTVRLNATDNFNFTAP